jgi:hypothetical protein
MAEVAWEFIRTYYTNLVYSPDDVRLFYDEEDATIWRDQMPDVRPIGEAGDHLLPAIPKGSKVVISQFTTLPIPTGMSIVVYGKIGFGGEVRSFHQVFTLTAVEDRFFVVGDYLSFYRTDDGHFLPADGLFEVAIRREQLADGPPPAEAKPQNPPPANRPAGKPRPSSHWFWQNPHRT